MDLNLNNEIDINKSNKTNKEVQNFMNELQNSLIKDYTRTNELYNEILKEIPLAAKYKDNLNEIIAECMDNLSYECNFIYFDYDKKEKVHFLDGYSDGNINRVKMYPKDIKDLNLKNGTFWEMHGNDQIIEAEDLKDNIKINVEYELEMLDFKMKKGKG